MPDLRRSNQILSSLQALLCLRTPSEASSSEAILTAAPQVWANFEYENKLFLDVSRVLGIGIPWSSGQIRQFDSQLEEFVLQQLIAVGWPPESAVVDYRPNVKSRERFDIGLLDEHRQLIAVVEVARTARLHAASPESIASRFFNHGTVQHAIVTDGDTYYVLGANRESRVLSTPPSPSSLGIAITNSQAGEPQTVLRPESVTTLRAIMAEHAPEQVAVDFTLPYGHRLSEDHPLWGLESAGNMGNARGPVESLQVISAWIASCEHVQALATIVPPAYSWSPSSLSWRECMTESLSLSAHIELPAGAFAPSTQLRTSYLVFRKGTSAAYFDSLTAVTDLIDVDRKPWFRSFSSWLAGTRTSQGFTLEEVGVESWAISHNDPEAASVRERLSRFGESKSLGELVDVRQGRNIPRTAQLDNQEEGGVRIVDSRQLRTGELANDNDEGKFALRESVRSDDDYLITGDVLIPRSLTSTTRAIVFSANYAAVASNSVLVLRPRDDVSSTFIAEYLNSASGVRLLESVSAGPHVPQISTRSLREIPVPQIACELEEPLSDVEDACGSINAAADDLVARRLSLFDSMNADQFTAGLGELRRKAIGS